MSFLRKTAVLFLVFALILSAGCGKSPANGEPEQETAPVQAEKKGGIAVLFTGDVHCGINQGFGYAGLQHVREYYENQGYETLLVDCGDSIQGETIGTVTKGEDIIELMNAMKYDAAVPGNHEFDYGADYFVDLTAKAQFPYLSCNIKKNGEFVFEPYIIKEAAGKKIAFVGLTTPETITKSTPAYFQDESGKFIYDFGQGGSFDILCEEVQSAVDAARAEGADYVYAIGHIGLSESSVITCNEIIGRTSGIDVFLDGHSHDSDVYTVKNAKGEDVLRAASGTKLSGIGYCLISAEDGIEDINVLRWNNSLCAAELFGIENDISALVAGKMESLDRELSTVVAKTSYTLTIYDPVARDEDGNPIRLIRSAETNLGDLCTDAYIKETGADIAILNGGGIRADIEKGDITYKDILSVIPFNNQLCVIEATGQQILDALEWGAQAVPGEFGGFMQVSGMTYEIDLSVPSGCKRDENNMQAGIEGERRVKNVTVGGEPIDPDKTYTVAGIEYVLISNGDGLTAFDGCKVIQDKGKMDHQVVIDYITGSPGGELDASYADPAGQGRITITGK